jgi:hypothetical protein
MLNPEASASAVGMAAKLMLESPSGRTVRRSGLADLLSDIVPHQVVEVAARIPGAVLRFVPLR